MKSNALAWLIWTIAAAVLVMVLENPWYTLIILLVSRLMVLAFGRDDGFHFPIWRAGVIILIFSALYQAAFVHVGDTVLLRLPTWALVGGPITLEAIVDGLGNGLTLLALLSLFLALGAIVPVSDLLRLTPAALHDAGVVVLIAVTYIPETREHFSRIREAQAIRGHKIKGLRDWRPVFVPLLVGGLERAMRLAETMVARGYGASAGVDSSHAERLGLGAALLLATGGWLLAWLIGGASWFLVFFGMGIIVAILWRRGKRNARTRYRSAPWTLTSTLLVTTAALSLVVFLVPLPVLNRGSLAYTPYPALAMPEFDWLFGLILLLLALPAIAGRPRPVTGQLPLVREPIHDLD
jgi:energy-coupling factor transport system permease protein